MKMDMEMCACCDAMAAAAAEPCCPELPPAIPLPPM